VIVVWKVRKKLYFFKELVKIIRILLNWNEGLFDLSFSEGSLRVDANVSVNRKGQPWGVRTEVKNISSIRSLVNAIEYEVARQIRLLEAGDTVINETRSFDALKKETAAMRDKEVQQVAFKIVFCAFPFLCVFEKLLINEKLNGKFWIGL